MAWQDGSRFLVASGVKWGSGPKVYKGSKRDTPWNKDLLWKLYVEQEAKKMKVPIRSGVAEQNVEAYPPFMKSLAHATLKNEKSLPLYDPYRHDELKTGQVLTERDVDWKTLQGPHGLPLIQRGSPRTWSERKKAMEDAKKLMDTKKLSDTTADHLKRPESNAAGSARAPRSARSRLSTARSAGPPMSPVSAGGSATASRLAALERSLRDEQAKREALEGSLKHELSGREREKVRLEKKLRAYDTIMKGLMDAMNKEGKLPKDIKMPPPSTRSRS